MLAAQAQQIRVSAGQFQDKFQSKKEVYRFLTHDNGIYLPKYETVTSFHMRDLVAGKRKKIFEINVKHITVPQFEGLKIELMLEFAANREGVMDYLPMLRREIDAMP